MTNNAGGQSTNFRFTICGRRHSAASAAWRLRPRGGATRAQILRTNEGWDVCMDVPFALDLTPNSIWRQFQIQLDVGFEPNMDLVWNFALRLTRN